MIKRKYIILAILMMFVIQSSAMATTANFVPTQAVSIQDANGNAQSKLDPLLVVHASGSYPLVGSFTIISKTLLKFDLASLPKDATIDSAQLTLTDSTAAGNGGADVSVSLFDNNNWDQSTNKFPTGNSQLLSNKVVANTGIYTWDVKQGISSNLLTMILETNSNDAVGFNGLGTTAQPTLVVSYTEPSPSPSPTPSPSPSPSPTPTPDESETVQGSPSITSSSPDSPFVSNANEAVTFDVEINQSSNVIWTLDGTNVKTEDNVDLSEYNNSDAAIGNHTLDVKISNSNGSDSMEWNWTVAESINPSVDNGNNGTINGVVFNDINNNGERNRGERGISGVTVRLNGVNGNENIILTTKTRRSGRYSFNKIPLGSYKVTIGKRQEFTVDLTQEDNLKTVNLGRRHRS